MTQKAMKTTDIWYKLGLIYYKRGKLHEAVLTWQKLLREDPQHIAARELINKVREELKLRST